MRKNIILIFAITCLMLLSGCTENILLKINKGVSLPEPNTIEEIYRFDYKEGDDFEIWKYTDLNVKTIKNKKIFNIITSDNIEDVKKILTSYYNDLSYDENLQTKFNEKFSIEDMVTEKNYYALLQEENSESYLLLYLNLETKELYYFNHVR